MQHLAYKASNLLLRPFYSWRHRQFDEFIFIHINKTGGSSIEKALWLPFEHKTALEKIDELGKEAWNNKFTFTVVRNPWDRVVSHYHYRVQKNKTGLGKHQLEFNEWVILAYKDNDPAFYNNAKMFMPQSDWISDVDGNILVDHICRFECLSRDFGAVCSRLGINANLPHLKASSRGDYRQYYTDDTAEIVSQWFRKDIGNFHYQF